LGLGVLPGESAVDVWDVLIVKLLTVQIKGSNTVFNSLILATRAKKARRIRAH